MSKVSRQVGRSLGKIYATQKESTHVVVDDVVVVVDDVVVVVDDVVVVVDDL